MDIDARVVSLPCWELFSQQDETYINEVLPPNVKARTAVEAGASLGWEKWVGDKGTVVSVERFGASANYQDNFLHYGFTVDNVIRQVKKSIKMNE